MKASLAQHLRKSTAYSSLMSFYYCVPAHVVKFMGISTLGYRKALYLELLLVQ